MIILFLLSCVFPTGLFIGLEEPSYTFDEPELFQTPITEVALMTSVESEQQIITEIALVQGTATQDTGGGGDYIFAIERAIFDPGVRRQIVPFALSPDLIAEGLENFRIRVTRSEDGPAYDCVLPQCISQTTINILDDDRKHLALQLDCLHINFSQRCTF